MWSSAYVWMNGHWENKLIVVLVEVVKVVHPDVLDVTGIDPAVGVGGVLDEHHSKI